MNHAAQVQNIAMKRNGLSLYSPPEVETNIARWRINGYPASIIIWTKDEWEKLTDRPSDAQLYPCGVWCALRLE